MVSEMMFIKQVMDFLNMMTNGPMNIKLDNSGALFLAENEYACQRTKHIDVRYHYIRQHVESGMLKMNLIKSQENVSDVFTKNLGYKLFWSYVYKLMEWFISYENQKE